MNNTKKILIVLSIVFNFASIAWEIFNIVTYFMLEPQNRAPIFYLIFDFITIFALASVIVLLIMSIWGNGKYFKSRYSLYMTALIISIIMNLFSIETVLLISTMFVSDIVWIKPESEDSVNVGGNVEVISKTKEEKISELRLRKEKGDISEEEFQAELMKLL